MGEWEQTVMCIDLKSFYASVECADHGLDPFAADLVVADPTRSENTICLAASPAIKSRGVKSRSRLHQISGDIDYAVAMPRMGRYMQVSADVVATYLRFVAPQNMHVYSIDESFINATPYLRLYRCTARELAKRMADAVLREHGITATVGIGPNMFLAKVALDLCAKHEPDGIAVLDQRAFRERVWFHRPITDVWGIGPGIARRLARYGVIDLAGVCAMRPATLRREFGKNAELLIDHAWGLEPCTVAEARSYHPRVRSLANGQVLMRDYSFDETRTLLKEMVHESVLEMTEKDLLCSAVGVWVGLARLGSPAAMPKRPPAEPHGMPPADRIRPAGHGRGPGVGASHRFLAPTDNEVQIVQEVLALFERKARPGDQARRVGISLDGLVPADGAQTSLFDDADDAVCQGRLQKAEAQVRRKFGANSLLRATSLRPEGNARMCNDQIGGHRA